MRNSAGKKKNPMNEVGGWLMMGYVFNSATCGSFSAMGHTEMTPDKHVACADSKMDRSVTLGQTCAPHEACWPAAAYPATACLCCLWALPLGCWTHCRSNCCHADLSCTSLKLIGSHSIHFTNMCSNYCFARVIIKWESIRNKRK